MPLSRLGRRRPHSLARTAFATVTEERFGFALCGRAGRVAKLSLHGFRSVAIDCKINFAAVSRNLHAEISRADRATVEASEYVTTRLRLAVTYSRLRGSPAPIVCGSKKSPAYLNGMRPFKYAGSATPNFMRGAEGRKPEALPSRCATFAIAACTGFR